MIALMCFILCIGYLKVETDLETIVFLDCIYITCFSSKLSLNRRPPFRGHRGARGVGKL